METAYKSVRMDWEDGVAVMSAAPPPHNHLSPRFVMDLHRLLQTAFDRRDIQAIVLTGTANHFIAGADIAEIAKIRSREDCIPALQAAHQMLTAIENGPKPVIAAINGHCSRGGLEIALACHYRIAARKIRVGFLDVRFGLMPGSGGTQRLPRLVGLKPALEILTTGRDIPVEEALPLGLVDEVTRFRDLAEKAREAARRFIQGRINFRMRLTGRRFDKLVSMKEKKDITSRFRERLGQTAKGHAAPFKILDAVEQGLGLNLESDLRLEMALYCDCVLSPESRNLIRLFLNTRDAGDPAWIRQEHPRKIRKIGILGAGTLGAGLTALLLKFGHEIWLWDLDSQRMRKGLNAVRSLIQREVRQGTVTAENMNEWMSRRLKLTTSPKDFGDVDWVIESVAEDLVTKQRLFKRMEAVCRPDAVFAATSLVLPASDIARVLANPERMIGFRVFHPPTRMQLVEVAATKVTSDGILATAIQFARKIGKTPVMVNDGPGFFVSREILAVIHESCQMISEGVDPFRIDLALTAFGLPVGPIQIADGVGLDRVRTAFEELGARCGDRWSPSAIVNALCDAGWLGRETGAGWYDYAFETAVPHDMAATVLLKQWAEAGISPVSPTENAMIERLMARAVNEGAFMIEEGLTRPVGHMDMALVYGIGFPPHLGGMFRYADTRGIGNILDILARLESEKGPRYRPCKLLTEMAAAGKRFYESDSD